MPFGCGSCSDSGFILTVSRANARHQCLSAVGPVRTDANKNESSQKQNSVTSAFRLWVLFGPPERAAEFSAVLKVTSAFRLWVLFGLSRSSTVSRSVTARHQCLSAVGPVRTRGGVLRRSQGKRRHQCLSAVGPVRTVMRFTWQNVVFLRHQCLSAVGPVRTGPNGPPP